MTRTLGHVLLWIGFVTAAFFSVSQLEQPGDKWSTIPWWAYTASMAIGIAGIVLLRKTTREADSDVEKTEAQYAVVLSSLKEVSAIVARLADQTTQHVPSEVLHAIDNECAEPLADFAESRQAMAKRFGMELYANVMTEFASAERYVNRSWSAAADGYVDEVATSLTRAKLHLVNAQDLISAAENQ